ncbi:MAG: hypothetical protein VYB44_07335 [Bacteroidota bacterium]|nr:hypothetical protein [Bacteroidota bacterium]
MANLSISGMELRDYIAVHSIIPHTRVKGFQADYTGIPDKKNVRPIFRDLHDDNDFFSKDELSFITKWWNDEGDMFTADTPTHPFDLNDLTGRIQSYGQSRLEEINHNITVDFLREAAEEFQYRYFLADQMIKARDVGREKHTDQYQKIINQHNKLLSALKSIRGIEVWISDIEMKKHFQSVVYNAIDSVTESITQKGGSNA